MFSIVSGASHLYNDTITEQNQFFKDKSHAQWTRVNSNSNRTNLCAGLCDTYQIDPILCRLGFNFDGARTDFLQYPAYHRRILPTPLAQFSVHKTNFVANLLQIYARSRISSSIILNQLQSVEWNCCKQDMPLCKWKVI